MRIKRSVKVQFESVCVPYDRTAQNSADIVLFVPVTGAERIPTPTTTVIA